MIIDPKANDVAAAIEAGKQLGHGAVNLQNGAAMPPAVLRHQDYVVEFHPEFQERPYRKSGTLTVHNLESFCRQFAKYKTPDSIILVDADPTGARGANFVGIINYHSTTAAEHGDFRVAYTAKLSVEWQRWMSKDKVMMPHAAFIEHLEDCSDLIYKPEAAAFMELIQKLEGCVTGRFENAVNLHNGSMRLAYMEDVKITASQSSAQEKALEVPREITAKLPVFEYDAAYPVECKLRYRVPNKALAMGYEVQRAHLIVQDAVAHQVAKVEELAGVKALYGVPPTK